MTQVTRLFDLFPYQLEHYPQEVALAAKKEGKWEKFSSAEVNDLSDRIALGLLHSGYAPGDMIAIISHTNADWILADQAIQKMGGIVVPIYPTSTPEDIAYILGHCEAKAIFVNDPELMAKISEAKSSVPSLKGFYGFCEIQGATFFRELEREADGAGKQRLADLQEKIKTDDLATIIYTSGTTGNPKGVMLSHRNILSNLYDAEEILPFGQEHLALSFLPLSHIFERMINYLYFFAGTSVWYAESLETIGENLKELRPHVFTAVPRLLEKVFEKIQAKGAATPGLKGKIFAWATKIALSWEPEGANGGWYNFKHKLADRLVFSKIRAGAGLDRVIALASGSSALNPRLARYFNALGIPLVEGYGLTETSPVISVNQFGPGEMRIGTVGMVIPSGEVKIAEDGEILYRGPNVMLGYYKAPEATAEVLDAKGWFHTGDIGEYEDKFLKITDRKKEMFKTSGGKYVAPQLMENRFKESAYIDQVMVIGEYRKFPGALIVPNWESLGSWCGENGVVFNAASPYTCANDPKVLALFQEEVDRMNEPFAKWEKVKRFALVPGPWTPESGLVTPKLSLRRKRILAHFERDVEDIYDV